MVRCGGERERKKLKERERGGGDELASGRIVRASRRDVAGERFAVGEMKINDSVARN